MTVLLLFISHLRTQVKATELTGWLRRLTSLFYRAMRRRGSVSRFDCVRKGGRTCGHSRGEPQDVRLSQPRGGHTRIAQNE
jgi:hypothetical protein